VTDEEKLKSAIDTVARICLAEAIDDATQVGGSINWTDYPEIGESDFEDVLTRVKQIADSIATSYDAYRAAYEHLAERSETLND
jgi:long-subunit fatty acid transport protein